MIINRKCIIRLSRYKNSLKRLKAMGFVKVFSTNLADASGASATQVRKDFSLFGIKGNRRGGYQVDELIDQLRIVLGKNKTQKVVIVGVGHIGQALFNYKGFLAGGIEIVSGFDTDPEIYTQESDFKIYPLEKFREYIKDNNVKIGILAVPDYVAQQVAELMVSSGIKGILNFAPIQLRVSGDVIINNINLEVELENLIYFVNAGLQSGDNI